MTQRYIRPILARRRDLGADAVQLAGGQMWFEKVEVLTRSSTEIAHIKDVKEDELTPFLAPRAPLTNLSMDATRIMGILNVTPDSFSDGGALRDDMAAVDHAKSMVQAGADIIDIGGESTRPGADFVPVAEEVRRTAPVIQALSQAGIGPISLDTRKADVARGGLAAGTHWINDVSALTYDADMENVVASSNAPLCLMHAQGDPKTMQANPVYDNVVLDVYDFLSQQVDLAVQAGIDRARIMVDPGIGFGKTADHNLAILQNLSLFHGLGCVVLLGASRKRFIGTLTGVDNAADRVAGSVAIALAAAGQGVQIIRVHDVAQTRQALDMWAHL